MNQLRINNRHLLLQCTGQQYLFSSLYLRNSMEYGDHILGSSELYFWDPLNWYISRFLDRLKFPYFTLCVCTMYGICANTQLCFRCFLLFVDVVVVVVVNNNDSSNNSNGGNNFFFQLISKYYLVNKICYCIFNLYIWRQWSNQQYTQTHQ